MTLTVGVIGLGNIGGGVAANLLKAGFAVRGYDTDAARIADAGVVPAPDAGAIAAACDLAILDERVANNLIEDGSLSHGSVAH